ncbi:alpha/beta hydrolase [Pendulispora albinea]|uniref:Alpha/beta hydrolase n=1 Tax=Pendulispora albinea TaxID=2741071 RepID=A0ABZ2MCQ0_9BACT
MRRLGQSAPAPMRERFDIIGFDPRGVGASVPLACQNQREYSDAWAQATARPERGQFDRALQLAKEFNDACVRESADRLPYVGTQYTARDMDVLREAAGDKKLNYFGISFGTFIGTVYANLFPKRIRVLALDGAYDPETYANRPYEYDLGQYVAVDAALKRFFDWCKDTPESCSFGNGNPAKAFLDLQASLDANPIRNAEGRVIANGATLVLQIVFDLNRARPFWPTLAKDLAQAQTTRDGRLLAEVSAGTASFLGMNTAIECADRDFPRDKSLLRTFLRLESAVAPYAGPAIAFGPPGYDHGHAPACVQWPAARRSRYAGPWDAAGSPPILVVGTTGDPDTPYPDAVSLARKLDNARLLTFKGEGHTGYSGSACARAAISDYLVDRVLPARGAVCDDALPPTTN